MPRPATCSTLITFPDGRTIQLAAQTARPLGGGDGYGMSWSFKVPNNMDPGPGTGTTTCTYPGVNLPVTELGFTVVDP
jgi:hypothetical protein